jgi:hypothetical protein
VLTLTSQAAAAASGTDVISEKAVQRAQSGVFLLDVTAAATLVGHTLDVYLQSSVDGTAWDDFAHFTQVLGNGGAKKFLARWQGQIAPTTAQAAPQDAALAAGVTAGPLATNWRVKWVIVGGTFSFDVKASLYLPR